MRLAVISDELSQHLDVVVDTARELGFEGVEVRSFAGMAPDAQPEAALRGALALVKAAGLEVAGYCPPALKCPLPKSDTEIAAARRTLVDAVSRAAWVGAPHVRIFSFYRGREPDPASAAAAFREVVAGLTLDVPLLLETGTRTNTPNVALAEQFLEQADGRVEGLLWDPGNSVFAGFLDGSVLNEWERGRHVIRHVHVKDPRGRSAYVRLGEGDVPWREVLQRMNRDAYGGWLSLETHWRINGELSPALRDEPHGFAFSDGGYGASVECMQILRDWLRAI